MSFQTVLKYHLLCSAVSGPKTHFASLMTDKERAALMAKKDTNILLQDGAIIRETVIGGHDGRATIIY